MVTKSVYRHETLHVFAENSLSIYINLYKRKLNVNLSISMKD